MKLYTSKVFNFVSQGVLTNLVFRHPRRDSPNPVYLLHIVKTFINSGVASKYYLVWDLWCSAASKSSMEQHRNYGRIQARAL